MSGRASRSERISRRCPLGSPVSKLEVSDVPSGAVSLNVEGRHVVGPLQGFGQLWQKTYRVRLTDVEVTPEDVVGLLKQKLPEYMPDNSRFYPSVTGVEPGEVVLINATLPESLAGSQPGVMVLYGDDESFTLMCPEGHSESGVEIPSAPTTKTGYRGSDPIVGPRGTIRYSSLAFVLWAVPSSRRNLRIACLPGLPNTTGWLRRWRPASPWLTPNTVVTG